MRKAVVSAILIALCIFLCACGSASSVVPSDDAVETNPTENSTMQEEATLAPVTDVSSNDAIETNLEENGTIPEEAASAPVAEPGDSAAVEEEQSADVCPVIGNWASDDGTTLSFREDQTGHIHVEVNYGNGLMGSGNDKDFVWKYDPYFGSYIVDIGAMLSGKITERDGVEIFSMAGIDFVRTEIDNGIG